MTAEGDSISGEWSYSYDGFSRLAAASCSGNCPGGQSSLGLAWAYDRYGNRWRQTVTAGSGPQPSCTFTGGNNRMDCASYNASGDVTGDGDGNTYSYDAEGRIAGVGGNAGSVQYIYGASGRRAGKVVNGAVTGFVYDLSNRDVAEFDGSGNLMRSEVFANGLHLATYYNNTTYFDHADWLGTERARSPYAGGTAPSSLAESLRSDPWGDAADYSGGDLSDLHFTGKMRDAETGLDYFGARYNASGWGRFMTPDWSAAPSGVPYASFADPRSLDLYVYLEDNPTSGVDADGHASLAERYENLYPDGPIPADAAIYMAPNGGPMLLPQPVSTATEDMARRKGEAYAFALFWGGGHGRGGRPGKGERRHAAKPDGAPNPIKGIQAVRGRPRSAAIRSSTPVSRRPAKLVSTSGARHSRVSGPPRSAPAGSAAAAIASRAKSSAHCWFAAVAAAAAGRVRAQCFRFFLLNAKPSLPVQRAGG